MHFLKKSKFLQLLLLGLFFWGLTTFADDTNAYDMKAPAKVTNDQKLTNSLQETNLEIKMRQKIEKELQEKQQVSSPQLKGKSALQENQSWWYIALMYVPNRLIDLSDIITLEGGAGPEASLVLTCTKYGQFGLSYGDKYFLEKGYNRQYGGGYSSGYNSSFLCWNAEEQIVDYTFGTVNPYVKLDDSNSAIPCPCEVPYKDHYVDFWRIGVQAGWLFDVGVSIHPVAMANFLTGFFFVRLTDTNDI